MGLWEEIFKTVYKNVLEIYQFSNFFSNSIVTIIIFESNTRVQERVEALRRSIMDHLQYIAFLYLLLISVALFFSARSMQLFLDRIASRVDSSQQLIVRKIAQIRGLSSRLLHDETV